MARGRGTVGVEREPAMAMRMHEGMLTVRPTAQARATATTERRVAGLLLFVLAAQFMTVIMLAASILPAYDYSGAAISDLGVFKETALLFNASLLAVGLLNIVGGLLFYRSHRRPWVLATYVLAGVGAIGAGLITLGTSDLHSLFALVAFVCFNLEAIATGGIVNGPLRAVSILAGLVGFVFVVLMVIGDGGNTAAFGAIGHGGTERMIVYPAMLWMLALGGYLMAATDREADA
jgi:hypothetical membrane protein